MTSIIATAVRYRLIILVLSVVAMVVGGASLARMSVNLLPNLSPTNVEVQTEALGLSAQEVEAMITVPLEADMLNGVPWLDRIESRSITGLSSIEMFFEPGTDLMVARQMVQERLTAAHALPNVSAPPVMRQPVATDARVVHIGLTSETLSLIDLSVLARWTIRPRLSGVPGVANISIWGERTRQMQVVVDPDVLARSGVRLEDVIRTSGNSLWVSSLSYLQASTPGTGGFIDTPNQRLGIQHVFPILAPADMKGLPLAGAPDKVIGDVANVIEGHQPLIGDSLVNGRPGLLLVVEKFPWSSSEEVARDVRQAMARMQPGLPGVSVEMGIFSAGQIAESAANRVRLVAVIGAVAAVLLIALSLRDIRVSVVAAVTAGAAILVAGGLVANLAATINGALIAGLFAGIGLILRDALQTASLGGTRSENRTRTLMIVATLAALLATVPLFFLGDVGGVVARQIAWPYVIAISTSLVAAFFVGPAVRALIEDAGSRTAAGQHLRSIPAAYRRLPPKTGPAILGALLVAGALVLVSATMPAAPIFRNDNVLVEWTAPPGASIEAMIAKGDKLSQALLDSKLVEHAALQVGRAEISDEVLNANAGTVWLTLADGVSARKAEAEIRQIASESGLEANVTSYQNRQIERSATDRSDSDVLVRIYGHEYDRLSDKAEEVARRLARIDGVDSAEIRSLELEPLVEIEVNLAKAKAMRIKPGDVRRAISALVGGIEVGSFFEDQKVFNVVVWGDDTRRSSLDAMMNAVIDVPGGSVPLTDLAEVRVAEHPAFINRSAVSRYMEIGISAPDAGQALLSEISAELADIDFPLEYHAEITGGLAVGEGNGGASVWQVAVAALIGVVLLLQIGLNSWSRAFLAVGYAGAVAATGVLVAFLLGSWSVAAAVGAVAVFGIGLRDSATVLGLDEFEGELSTILVGNGASVVALLPAIILFAPGLEFVWPVAVTLIGGSIGSVLLSQTVLASLAGAEVDDAFAVSGNLGEADA